MKRRIVIALGSIILTAGCTHMYTPKTSKFDMNKIPQFAAKEPVALVNGQNDKRQVLFARNAGHKFNADFNEWTDVAIEITARELAKRGGVVGDTGKSMTLSVQSAKVTTGGWGFRGYAELRVITGGGYEQTYKAETPSGNLYNAADGALARAVVSMLSDKNIIDYLSK